MKGRINYCDIDNVEEILETQGQEISWFINTACRYCKENVSDSEILEANLLVPLNVFMLCRKYNIQRFLTIDTGLPGNLNVYCKSKEEFARLGKYFTEKDLGSKEDCTFYNILLENFYGEDEPQNRFLVDTISKMRQGLDILLTEGQQHRDFIYIEDVVRNLVELIGIKNKSGYHDIPLGSGEAPTIRELMEFLKENLHSESKLLFGAVPMRTNEPDSVADKEIMGRYGIQIRWPWRKGMLHLLKRQEELGL